MSSISSLITVLLVAITARISLSQIVTKDCCTFQQPESNACTADFVVLASLSEKTPSHLASVLFDENLAQPKEKDSLVYELTLHKVYKEPLQANGLLKSGELMNVTTLKGDKCAPTFSRDTMYLLTGDVWKTDVEVTRCDLHVWSNLTESQRQGYSGLYYNQCQ